MSTREEAYEWNGPLFTGASRGEGERYLAEPGLVHAVNVALLLGQPLLLTGEPGSGKTRLAHAIASELGLPGPYVANVKSTTTARDLLYRFDELWRFRDAQAGRPRPLIDYMSIDVLGRAILIAGGPDKALVPMPGRDPEPQLSRHRDVLHGLSFPDRPPVVLIDELDKAGRDTPNDLLDELDNFAFDMPELGLRAVAPKSRRPVVIITSNSEKSLPDPFLRRCVYYHLPFPRERLAEIAALHLVDDDRRRPTDPARREEALALFAALRGIDLRKPPGTAELIAWMRLVLYRDPELADRRLRDLPERIKGTLTVLLKKEEDRERGHKVVDEWARLSAPT